MYPWHNQKDSAKANSKISLFLNINAHIQYPLVRGICTVHVKRRCALYLDLREPRNTTNLIIW